MKFGLSIPTIASDPYCYQFHQKFETNEGYESKYLLNIQQPVAFNNIMNPIDFILHDLYASFRGFKTRALLVLNSKEIFLCVKLLYLCKEKNLYSFVCRRFQ
jgi:hypothetical protein